MIVRRSSPEDSAAIRAIHSHAFARPDQLGAVAEATLVDELQRDGSAIPQLSLVALVDGAIAGHVICSRGDLAGAPFLGLGPLGVRPSDQGRGVGTALMHAVIGGADALGEPGIALLGSEGYYRRFGFVPAAKLGILAPDPAWGSHFQIRALSGWDASLRGAYRYAAAFDRV